MRGKNNSYCANNSAFCGSDALGLSAGGGEFGARSVNQSGRGVTCRNSFGIPISASYPACSRFSRGSVLKWFGVAVDSYSLLGKIKNFIK